MLEPPYGEGRGDHSDERNTIIWAYSVVDPSPFNCWRMLEPPYGEGRGWEV